MRRGSFGNSMISLTLKGRFSVPKTKALSASKTISNPFVVPIQVREFKLELVKPEAYESQSDIPKSQLSLI